MSSVTVCDLCMNFGRVAILKQLDLEVVQGEFLVLLGPSGCGKSTLLNCIAGLLDITDGQIFIDGKNVTWLEPGERGIGMVFQSYALYPKMSVERNLSFSLRVAGVPKTLIKQRVARAAEILQIESLLSRKPKSLSGGQQQRVAIGRAMVRDVDVYLFDEPLSNLDAKLRTETRFELKRLHRRFGYTMIYVTHDQIEALTLADRIAIMRSGVIEQLDTPTEVYNQPQNRFVAEFLGTPGMNFLPGRLDSIGGSWRFQTIDSGGKVNNVLDACLDRYGFSSTPHAGQLVELGVRPEHIAIDRHIGPAFAKTTLDVEYVEPMGSDSIAWGEVSGKRFAMKLEAEQERLTNAAHTVRFDVARASLFDAESGRRV